jgi:hypothetical protein
MLLSILIQLHACYNLLLCAVAVHHSPNDQHKTIFRTPEDGFKKTSEFVAKLIALIKKEDREGVLRELGNLAELLQTKQIQLEEAPRKAKRGDAVLFPSDSWHAAAAPVVAVNEAAEDVPRPRVTSYYQFAPTVVVQNKEWWPLLRTLYDSEHVFDRRSMVARSQLLRLMTLHGEDPLVVEQAEHWLEGLHKGRVNCIQS